MFELEINGVTYQFKFGMRFMREMNKRQTRKIEGLDKEEPIGLSMAIARILDEDLDALYDVLREANTGFEPRLGQVPFDEWIESDSTDVDAVFKKVLDFFDRSNCTKKTYQRVKEQADKLM